MMIGGMVRHLRRTPIPDKQIQESLGWLHTMIDGVLITPSSDSPWSADDARTTVLDPAG